MLIHCDSIYYYNLILAIHEPLLDATAEARPMLQQIVDDASKHLGTLIRLYYLRHGFEAMDLFIVIPLILTGFKCVNALNDHTPAVDLDTLRCTLLLAAKGLYSQRYNHYLAEALYRVVRGQMRPQEAALLRDTVDIEEESEAKRAMMQVVRSHWPVSIVRKKEDLDSLILNNFVESYAHLNQEEPVRDGSS